MRRDARAGQFAVVVTEDLDRISRSQSDRVRIHERLQFAGVAAAIGKAVDALLGQEPSRALRDRLVELESERDAIEGEIAQLAPPAIEMHPKAGEVYRDKVRDLKAALQAADPDQRAQAIAHIRELVEKIVIHPRGKKPPVDIEIHGQFAALLKDTRSVRGPAQNF